MSRFEEEVNEAIDDVVIGEALRIEDGRIAAREPAVAAGGR